MVYLSALSVAAIVLGPGVLAAADPGVLEAVQARRVKYGWGLDEAAPAGTLLIAVDD